MFTNIIKLTQTKGLISLFTGLLRTEQAGPAAPGGHSKNRSRLVKDFQQPLEKLVKKLR